MNRGSATPHFTAHQLRHRYATLAYRDGVALEVIGAVLTHRSLSSTLIYTHLAAEDLRRVLAQRGVPERVADLVARVLVRCELSMVGVRRVAGRSCGRLIGGLRATFRMPISRAAVTRSCSLGCCSRG